MIPIDEMPDPTVRSVLAAINDGGRAFIARYRNDTWGEMRTSWRFTIAAGKIEHMATGQA